MGAMVKRTKSRAKCTCYTLPPGESKTDMLCFRKNFVGALDVGQMDEFCDWERSVIHPATDSKAQDILRTMKQFATGVRDASEDYQNQPDFPTEDRMGNWREKVSYYTSDKDFGCVHPRATRCTAHRHHGTQLIVPEFPPEEVEEVYYRYKEPLPPAREILPPAPSLRELALSEFEFS